MNLISKVSKNNKKNQNKKMAKKAKNDLDAHKKFATVFTGNVVVK